MILIVSKELLKLMSEVFFKIIKGHPEELLIGILLKSEISDKNFFTFNI